MKELDVTKMTPRERAVSQPRVEKPLLELQEGWCSACRAIRIEDCFLKDWCGTCPAFAEGSIHASRLTCGFCKILEEAVASGSDALYVKIKCPGLKDVAPATREFTVSLHALYDYDPSRRARFQLMSNEGIPWPQDSDSIRFDLIAKQIQVCHKEHRVCRNDDKIPVKDLRLIDCVDRTIVHAPAEAQYIALSYV